MAPIPSLSTGPLERVDGRSAADLIVIGCFEDETPAIGAPPALVESVEQAKRRFQGRHHEVSEAPLGTGRRAVILQGLGKREQFDLRRLRGWLRQAVHRAGTSRVRRLAIVLPAHEQTQGEAAAERIAREVALAGYRFDRYREPGDGGHGVKNVRIVPPDTEVAAYRRALKVARAVTSGVVLARDLGNTPPNIATPRWMAAQARSLARRHDGMRVRVLTPSELDKKGMGGILAVGGGSSNRPRLVRIDWGRRGPRVALVGKGVTFDTGGISLKPAASMEEMKYDKCGACTVLGVMASAAELKLPLRLTAYLPLAENMPDATAYRPSDIVRCYNGKTVEIINTDAEGRMILADALAWAVEGSPDVLVEFSTLTGAAVVALGQLAAGLYSPSDATADDLLEAADEAGERLWRMPLWPEFVEEMKGGHADLKNSGSRWGGANTAAAFLSQFVGDLERWAHVDIAGPAYLPVGQGGESAGATGYGVALTVQWLRSTLAA